MLLSTSTPTLVNGVSQQSETLRFPSQVSAQTNAYPDPLTGLSKRPPTQHVSVLDLAFEDNPTPSDVSVHFINRSASERRLLVMGDRQIKVTTLDGAALPVKREDLTDVTEADLGYLETENPRRDLKALTVADYTILLNKSKVTAQSSTVSAPNPPEALLFLRQFRAGLELDLRLYAVPTSSIYYRVVLKVAPEPLTSGANTGQYEIYATSDFTPGVVTTYYGIDQGDLMSALKSFMDTHPFFPTWTYSRQESLIHIRRTDNGDFRVELTSTIPDGAQALKGVVQNFALLPRRAYAGFRIKVVGDPETEGDEYYLRFAPEVSSATGFSSGSWVEAQAGSLQDSLDPTTLPHALVNMGSYFLYKPLDWSPRQAGDAETNPPPSFIGRPISNLFFHRNRLGFLSGENVVLSAASDYFRFFRKTVIQLLDDDPIDVGSGHSKVSLMKHAAFAAEKLVLFSEQTQFILGGSDLFTPRTVEIKPATDIECMLELEPKASGGSIFFGFRRGDSSGIMEYYVAADTGLFTPHDVTEQCPSYLPAAVDRLEVCDTENLLALSSTSEANSLYLYRYYKRGNDRLQSAWFKYEFSAPVLGHFFTDSRLFLVMDRSIPGLPQITLEYVETATNVTDASAAYTMRLDRRTSPQGAVVYNSGANTTTATLPYSVDADTPLVVTTSASLGSPNYGQVLTEVSRTATSITVRGNHTAALWIGSPYVMSVTLSRPLLRETRPNGSSSAVSQGRFQVRYGTIIYDRTLAFQVLVQPRGRDVFTKDFKASEIGVSTTVGAQPEISEGKFRFPVFSKNDQVTITLYNDTPYPCSFLSLDWEALYTARAQRV
jgi:hypothetical protein